MRSFLLVLALCALSLFPAWAFSFEHAEHSDFSSPLSPFSTDGGLASTQAYSQNTEPSPNAASDSPTDLGNANHFIARAKTQLNSMYHFGGSDVDTGFDCSGFVGWIFAEILRSPLPRTAVGIAAADAPKVSRTDLMPGDVLLYVIHGNRVSHVALYIGERKFIHATRPGQRLRIESMDLPYWRARYAGARRILGSALVHSGTARSTSATVAAN
jgi:cell wall-associated NlpC family hydrolase